MPKLTSVPLLLTAARLLVGIAARVIFFACLLFIVGNAVYGSVRANDYLSALAELAFFPVTFLLHPFMASPNAVAWPFEAGTSFIPALVVALIAYPVSTLIGGLKPVD